MKIEEAYIQYLEIVNRNATNNNLNVDKPRFILNFNKAQIEFTSWVLEKRNEDTIRHISPLLIIGENLQKSDTNSNNTTFSLPSKFFDLSDIQIFATNGKCKDKSLLAFEVKGENLNELSNDFNNKPSFEYLETYYLLSSKEVTVFKDDFEVSKVNLSYYRYPKSVDISGYLHLDNSQSTSIDPEFDDKVVHKILTAMAKQFSASTGDAQGFQLNKDKLYSEI